MRDDDYEDNDDLGKNYQKFISHITSFFVNYTQRVGVTFLLNATSMPNV
jgi:protein involved in sex pheromone biosynthesis